MNERLHDITPRQQTRAYAAWYGVQVGLLWIISFSLTIYGMLEPLAGQFGLLSGLGSVPFAVWLMRQFREQVAPLPLRRAWHMAWMLFLCAALLLTFVQYIYFEYFDGGFLARSYGELLTNPEYRPMLESLLPGQNIDAIATEMTTLLSTMSPVRLALQFMPWSVIAATLMALPTALFSFTRPDNNNKQE